MRNWTPVVHDISPGARSISPVTSTTSVASLRFSQRRHVYSASGLFPGPPTSSYIRPLRVAPRRLVTSNCTTFELTRPSSDGHAHPTKWRVRVSSNGILTSKTRHSVRVVWGSPSILMGRHTPPVIINLSMIRVGTASNCCCSQIFRRWHRARQHQSAAFWQTSNFEIYGLLVENYSRTSYPDPLRSRYATH